MCFKWKKCIFGIFSYHQTVKAFSRSDFQPLRLLKDVSPGSDAFFPSRGSFAAASETSSAAGVHKLRLERHPALLNMIRAPTHKLNAHD